MSAVMVGKFVRYQGVTGGGTRFRFLSRVKREIVGFGIRKCRYHYILWDVVGEPLWNAMGGQGRGMQAVKMARLECAGLKRMRDW